MSTPVDPMKSRGRWVVTTASGAVHLIDSTRPDEAVVATRVTAGPAGDDPQFPLGTLRRDGETVLVVGVQNSQDGTIRDGIVVGADMYLTLEPLDPRAYATVRRTTPVLSIEELLEEASLDE
jgi:hypothetical protein